MRQLTKQQAIEFYKSEVWQGWEPKEIARFQLFQDLLCVKFDSFHAGIEELLGRPVWTHEFADLERLRNEYLTLAPPPTLEDIMVLLPQDKIILIMSPEDKEEK